jgi:hypothetical protein
MGLELLSECNVTCTGDKVETNSKIGIVRSDMEDVGAGLDDVRKLAQCHRFGAALSSAELPRKALDFRISACFHA